VTVVGCSTATAQPTHLESDPYPFLTDNIENAKDGNEPYPFEKTTPNPETTSELEEFETVPSPSHDYGVVTGILLQPGDQEDPYLAEIFLGRAIEAQQPGYEPIVGFSREMDPKAVQDQETGEFYFSDILPGKYALIIWNPISSYIFKDENSGGFLFLDVQAGSTLNLGELRMP